jgi:hypothetical protein
MSAMIENISAITLATHDMARAVGFYRMLGFEVIYGGGDAAFTSLYRGRRPDCLRSRLQAWPRRHCVKAQGFRLPFRSLARLAQEVPLRRRAA